jgi:rhamnogalacturonyl hydrolase YesR
MASASVTKRRYKDSFNCAFTPVGTEYAGQPGSIIDKEEFPGICWIDALFSCLYFLVKTGRLRIQEKGGKN